MPTKFLREVGTVDKLAGPVQSFLHSSKVKNALHVLLSHARRPGLSSQKKKMPSNFPTFDPTRLTKKSAAAQYSSGSEDEGEGDGFAIPQVDPSAQDDEFGDFNPRKRRRVGNSKEQAALGIFASDSEDDGPGRQWKKKSLRGKGMNFVSTGAPKSIGEEKEYSDDSDAPMNDARDEDEDPDDEEEEEEEGNAAGLGLGFRPANGGLGFKSASRDEQPEETDTPTRPSFGKTKFDGRNPLGRGFVPSSAKQPVLQDTASENASTEPPQVARPSAFSSAKGSKGKINANSFGARMMAKMGYVEGKGLGKEGQGRNVIIEANLRPQGAGLGAVKEKSEAEKQEEKRQARMRGEVVVDSDEEERRKKRERAKKKKIPGSGVGSSAASTPRRQKTSFMTAEQLKKNAPGLHIPDAFAPILDMTGPGNKLLTSTSGLLTPTSGAAPESRETAEARKIVRRAHADLAAFSEEWRNLEERKSWVDLELREREQEMADLASDLDRLELFANIVAKELPAATEWSDVVRCLQRAAEHIGDTSEDISDIAVAAVHPFFRDPDWYLLEEPKRFATELSQGLYGLMVMDASKSSSKALEKQDNLVPGLNDSDIYRHHQKATTPYETMMYKLWYPKAMTAVREWDVHEPAPLLAVIETWNDLLPPFVRAQLLDAIVRKLESALADWNPRKRKSSRHGPHSAHGGDTKLPHLWLFPWLPHLPHHHLEPKGTGLVAEVRRKFRQLIEAWDFSRGVIPGLQSWRDVLGKEWQPLIMSHVLPSMGRYLRENFRVDPSDQEPYLPMLSGVLAWSEMLGPKVMGQVVVSEIFPLWHEKLSEWLGLEEMNLEEVYMWYEWWKDQVFPPEISSLRAVQKEFEKGTATMERALGSMEGL